MRILIISYRFPPFNSIGAVRVGKTAKYLIELGHEVRVISAGNQSLQSSLELEIPAENVTYTDWFNVNRAVEILSGGRQRVASQGFARQRRIGFVSRVGRFYKDLANLPDGQIGWYPYAVTAARKVVGTWRPDIIFASAMPFTSLMVAASISRKFNIPWVAELRDLLDYGDENTARWRRKLNARIESKTLQSASGLVTVSEPLAQTLRSRFEMPVEVVINGFDPNDYGTAVSKPAPPNILTIVYTGMIYEGRRDPSPLFKAIAELGELKSRVRVTFFGKYLESVNRLAEAHGVQDQVEVHPAVSYAESLQLQQSADILLLLLWDSPQERGVFTGKLFEYIGSRRPILVIGPIDNVGAQLVEQRAAGKVSLDPATICSLLGKWIKAKDLGGPIPSLPEEVGAGLTRFDQVIHLVGFLEKCSRHPIRRWQSDGPACPPDERIR